MTEPRISVVVPTYNRLDTLRRVVPTLLAQDLDPIDYEVLICDSNSSDGTREFLAGVARERPSVRHLPGAYGGRGAARNAGIRAARGAIVLFNDADILAAPNLLSAHLARHDRPGRRAVVGWEVQCASYEEYLRKRDDVSARGSLHPRSRSRLSWLYFLTGNASAPREALDRVGGFDETFTGYGHEDLELGWRLVHEAGLRIEYAPEAVNYHWQDVPPDEQQGKMELAGRSTVRFFRKHPTAEVRWRLGMSQPALWLHDLVQRTPALESWIEAGAARPGFARTLSYQYHYLNGVKAALRGDE